MGVRPDAAEDIKRNEFEAEGRSVCIVSRVQDKSAQR
jgi:hypothetical protein